MKKQTTALHDAINYLKDTLKENPNHSVSAWLPEMISDIEKYLPKEKEQIKLAFDHGQNGEFYQPEKYFNENFEQ